MRYGAFPAALEKERGNARISHVEEDRRNESRREKFCALLRGNITDCVYGESVYGEQLCRFCDCVMEEYIE